MSNAEPIQRENLRVAAIQMVSSRDQDTNLATAERLRTEAHRAGAEMAVVPENFVTYGNRHRPSIESQEHFLRTFADLAKRLNLWIVAGTYPLSIPPATVSTANQTSKPQAVTVVFDNNGQIRCHYAKIHLFDVDVSDSAKRYRESDDFLHGDHPVTFDSPWGGIGVSVCYDLRFAELYIELVKRGAGVMVVPSAFVEATGRDHWEILLRARAIECQCFVVAANQGGHHGGKLRTWGESMIIDPWGRVLQRIDKGEGLVVADIDLSSLATIRARMPIAQHRRL